MLQMLLVLAGHDVHAAADGPSGVELARQKRPDIAVIDPGLPGMDGYEVARRLRKEPRPELRLIALSGYGQAADLERSAAAGFDHHLVKPADPDLLNGLLADVRG